VHQVLLRAGACRPREKFARFITSRAPALPLGDDQALLAPKIKRPPTNEYFFIWVDAVTLMRATCREPDAW
jgi:hypothetical protein